MYELIHEYCAQTIHQLSHMARITYGIVPRGPYIESENASCFYEVCPSALDTGLEEAQS